MSNQTIMNIAALKKLLNEIGSEVSDDYQVWLSSDEEGNEFLPVFDNGALIQQKRTVFGVFTVAFHLKAVAIMHLYAICLKFPCTVKVGSA